MRIAVVKPDHGGVGGFERLVDRCVRRLRHHVATLDQVEVVTFDASTHPTGVLGVDLTGIGHQHPEFFLDMARIVRMDRLDLSAFDVVVATQPPTHLVDHPDVVALCFHQARIYYDLAEEYVAAGFVDGELHAAAVEAVRAVDADRIGGVGRWLTGSDEVAGRLERFWGIRDTTPFRARAEIDPSDDDVLDSLDPTGPVLCVSRHEWPKRTELLVQAAAHDPTLDVDLIGGGTRLAWVRALAARVGRDPAAVASADPSTTWRNRGTPLLRGDEAHEAPARIRIHGEVADAVRDRAYDAAGIVVAPALGEDYGLTVIEAWSRGRPVVVCDDGGGLVELVRQGGGVVCAPTGAAIADACAALRDDPERARALAADGLAAARRLAADDDLAVLVDAVVR